MRVAVSVALAKQIGQVLTPELAAELAREICATPDHSVSPDAYAPESYRGFTFQIERLRDAFGALQAQRLAYLAERDPGQPCLVDWDRLRELSRKGNLVIFTMRDPQGTLIGSMWVLIGISINTGCLSLTDDMLYVVPEHRLGWFTAKMWLYGERAAFSLGVREATIHSRLGNGTERLARFRGYQPDSIRATKRHYGESFCDAPTRHQ